MFGLREAGVLGASVALAGGLAYVIWSYAAASGHQEPESRPGVAEKSGRREAGKKRQKGGEEAGVKVVVTPVTAAAPPQQGSEQPRSRSAASGATQVLVLGLDGAGKTSLLHCLATSSLEQDIEPTQGFNAISINREDLHIEFLEIGGKEELRPYWQRYLSKALLLVFVVDSSEPQRFPVAKKHLHELLTSDPGLPLMVLANKQDLPGSCGITDLHEALSLSEAGDRKLFLIGTHVRRGEAEPSSGVQDARELIIQMVCDGK